MRLAGIAGHRILHGLPLWALAAGLNTSVLLGIVYFRAARQQTTLSTLTVTLVAWVGLATFLAFADVRTRCTHFEISLPASSRRLWLNNLIATLAGGLILGGLCFGVIAAHSSLPLRVDIEPHLGVLAVALFAGFALAVLLLQAPRPSLVRVPTTTVQIVWTACVLAGTPVLVIVAVEAGWWGLSLLLLLVLAMAFWSYRSVPEAYSLAPLEAGSAQVAEQSPAIGDAPPSRWLVPLTIVRCVGAGAKELAGIPFILMFGMVLGGALLAMDSGSVRELRFIYLPMTIYMLFALIGPRMVKLHYIDPLPISRRPLVAALVLPYFIVVCAGYGIGALVASDARSRLEYVNFEEGEDGYHVTVPLRVYRLALDGQPPPVESPWGESQLPRALTPVGWSRTAAYSPYSAPPGSSARFVALQISRAAERVYGVSLSPGSIEERYLTTREDGSVAPRGEGLTLRIDDPALRPRGGPMFPALVTLTVVPWLLLIALLLRAYRAGIREWVRQAIVWGSLAVLLGFVISTTVSNIFDFMQQWAIRALVEIPVMRLGESAAGTVTTWVVAALLLGGAYRIVQSQFMRMEIPTKPSQYTLIRMGQD